MKLVGIVHDSTSKPSRAPMLPSSFLELLEPCPGPGIGGPLGASLYNVQCAQTRRLGEFTIP